MYWKGWTKKIVVALKNKLIHPSPKNRYIQVFQLYLVKRAKAHCHRWVIYLKNSKSSDKWSKSSTYWTIKTLNYNKKNCNGRFLKYFHTRATGISSRHCKHSSKSQLAQMLQILRLDRAKYFLGNLLVKLNFYKGTVSHLRTITSYFPIG